MDDALIFWDETAKKTWEQFLVTKLIKNAV